MWKDLKDGGELPPAPAVRTGDLFEDPNEPLNYDPARYSPDEWNKRLVKIANSLMDRSRIIGHYQSIVCRLGVKSGETYKDVRTDQYILEGEQDALKAKFEAIKAVLYQKSNEMKHLGGQ